jgi:ubiquitin-conjugating enzyme (huntingtin interacting protein 2)
MRFITKVYHPNVSSDTGAISLSILQDEWSPALTLRTTLLSIQAFLCSPDLDEPLDAEVAKQYVTLPKCFEDTARNWTRIYARKPGGTA